MLHKPSINPDPNLKIAGIFIPHLLIYTVTIRDDQTIKFKEMEELAMKGFNTGDGYMGLVDGKYILFASESDYYEYMND